MTEYEKLMLVGQARIAGLLQALVNFQAPREARNKLAQETIDYIEWVARTVAQ